MNIKIDRSKPFDMTIVYDALSIVWQDKSSLTLAEVELAEISLVNIPTLESERVLVDGREKNLRVRASGYILLDAKFCEFFLRNQHRIPIH